MQITVARAYFAPILSLCVNEYFLLTTSEMHLTKEKQDKNEANGKI